MATKYIDGDTISFTAAADVVSGDIVAVGTLKGIVVRDAASGEVASLAIEGVYKVASAVTAVGTKVTLVVADQNAVATAAEAVSDGIVVGVYSSGVALVKLERGLVAA